MHAKKATVYASLTVKISFGATNVTNNVERDAVEILAIERQAIALTRALIHISENCVITNAANIVTLLRSDLVTKLTDIV